MSTKYLHSAIKWRKVRNGFNGLRDKGQWYDEQGAVKDKVREYFKERFSGEARQSVRLDTAGSNRITEEDNVLLVARISEEDVK